MCDRRHRRVWAGYRGGSFMPVVRIVRPMSGTSSALPHDRELEQEDA
jgi:hypothetical protein